MSEPLTPFPEGANVNSLSVVNELLQRAPAHSFLTGLFVYLLLFIVPEKEAWYWQQIEKQRKEFFEARESFENRKDAQLKEVEGLCHQSILNVSRMTTENQRELAELRDLIMEKCQCK